MKQIIMALAFMGFALSGAEAQSGVPTKCTCKAKRLASHRVVRHRALPLVRHERTATFANDYQVCTEHDGYYTCCLYKKTTTERR